MKLQKILHNFQKLHPKEIDLSLDRIKNLCEKLGNPQNKIQAISIVGTNGKNSTIQAAYSILKEANFECNVYTSPHILKINERFIFNNKELSDDELANLFEEVEDINNNKPITFFEILTASYFYKAAQYPENINLIEAGLFHRFDATNILKKNGLPYLVCITDPTAGGITASYAMLGDIHIAEPGALIAFAGARVIQGTVKEELPEGFQKSEYVEKTGFVDLIVERKDLASKIGTLLSILLKKNSDISAEQNETSEDSQSLTRAAS